VPQSIGVLDLPWNVNPRVLPGLVDREHIGSWKACLNTERAAGPQLAGQTVADRYAHWFTGCLDLQLSTAAACFASCHNTPDLDGQRASSLIRVIESGDGLVINPNRAMLLA
jgi:hypothetical protein